MSVTPADVLVPPSPEDIWWIRCWDAANACSAELCLCRACTASSSRLTNLAGNSSVVVMMYLRGSMWSNQQLRYHARSVNQSTTLVVRATRAKNNKKDVRDSVHARYATLFCLTDADGYPEMRVNKSREYALQVCAVSGPVVRFVLRSACNTPGNAFSDTRKLGWNTSAQQTAIARLPTNSMYAESRHSFRS